MKQVVAISDALSEIAESTAEGAFHAPRRLSPRASSTPSAPRNPTAAQARTAGEDFEEDGADWRVLTVEWDAGLEALVVWYYDADMAADANLTEDDMHLARTEGVDLDPPRVLRYCGGQEVNQGLSFCLMGGAGGAAKVAGRYGKFTDRDLEKNGRVFLLFLRPLGPVPWRFPLVEVN